MLPFLLSSALAASSWQSYAVGAGAAAIAMPLTYWSAEVLAGHSNKLVPGLLPSLLIGLTIPPTAAWAGSYFGAKRFDAVTPPPLKSWGTTVGLNTLLWAGGAALGVTTNEPTGALLYGAASALLLPLPTWWLSEKKGALSLQLQPLSSPHLLQGSWYGSF